MNQKDVEAFLGEIDGAYGDGCITEIARGAVQFGRDSETGWDGVYNYIQPEREE